MILPIFHLKNVSFFINYNAHKYIIIHIILNIVYVIHRNLLGAIRSVFYDDSYTESASGKES